MSIAAEPAAVRKRDPYLYYRKNLLSPDRVWELSQLRTQRVVLDTLCCWTIILAAFAMVAIWPAWWSVLLAIPIVGTRYYALFIIGHDALHRRLWPTTRGNDTFADLFIFGPIGAITRINNKNHLSHHRHLSTHDDPDRHKHGCFNKSRRHELFGFLTGLTSVFATIQNVFVRRGKTHTAARTTDASYSMRDLAVLVLWQAALISGLTLAIGGWAYPVLWLLPLYLFFVLGDNFRSFAEHSHPEADARADEHRLITYLANPVERMFFAPMNMNYHAAHHLWPSIPYYNLPTADREIRSQAASDGLEWRRSYIAYLWRYFRALPLEECRGPPSPPAPLPQGERGARQQGVNMPQTVERNIRTALPLPAEFAANKVPSIDVEEIPNCPVCGHGRFSPFAHGFDYELQTCSNCWRFVACEECRHVWLNPRPALHTLATIYPPTYYAYNYKQQISAIAVKGKELLDKMKFRGIQRYLARTPRSYLDIGCGDGRFLKVMENQGLSRQRIFGLELDEGVVQSLRRAGFQAFCRRVEDCDEIADNSLDLATMSHVIEHVDDPARVANKVFHWMAPGGIFAMETPNLESLDARWFHDTHWGGYHIPRHWNLFTPATLSRLLTDAGFEVVSIKYQTGHSFWMYSLHHSLRYGRKPRPWLASWFNPFKNVLPLALFTAFDLLRGAAGFETSAMLVLARKPGDS